MVAGWAAVVDALRRPPEIRFVRSALVRTVPERSVPAMETPERSAEVSAAPESKTFGPTITPLRNTYPAGRVAVAVPVRPEVRMFVRVAPVSMAPETSELVRTTFEMSALVRLALVMRTLLPKIEPPRPIYPVGRVAVASPMTLRERIFARVAPLRVAPERSVDTKIAFVKLARFSVAPYNEILVKSAPERSAP